MHVPPLPLLWVPDQSKPLIEADQRCEEEKRLSTIQCRVTHPATCFMASTCFIQLPSTNPGMFKQKYTNWAYIYIYN